MTCMAAWPIVVNAVAIEAQLKCERAAKEKFIARCVMSISFRRTCLLGTGVVS